MDTNPVADAKKNQGVVQGAASLLFSNVAREAKDPQLVSLVNKDALGRLKETRSYMKNATPILPTFRRQGICIFILRRTSKVNGA